MADGKIVILGGKGMLGLDVATAFQRQGVEANVLDLPDFDITDTKKLQQVVSNVQVVVNCAAYTDVEKAEAEYDLAYEVNAKAVGELGCIAAERGSWVLHISTDFVFDGKSDTPYLETDRPNPINAYGRSKLAGEKLLVESQCCCCIIRVEWTYGIGGDNFVTKLIKSAKAGHNMKVVDDQIGSPTATTEVAEVICDFVRRKPQGLFHFASDGYVSRFEMAKFVFDKLGTKVNIGRCKTADYKTAAKRPLNSCFDCGKISALLGKPRKHWQNSLERFLRKL